MLRAFAHGFILAIGLILPLGAQNIFVFNQGSLHRRLKNALPAIITAAICDTLLISIAVLGVSVAVFALVWVKTAIISLGILFLTYMGWLTWKSKPPIQNSNNKTLFDPKKQISFALSVSLLNPHAVLDTIGVIGTSSLQYNGYDRLAFTIACILVSWIWFFSLAIAGRLIDTLDKNGHILIILNKISALIIWGVAFYLAASLLT